MREIFTYGSVGGALGNQCFYPEIQKGSFSLSLGEENLCRRITLRDCGGIWPWGEIIGMHA